MINVERTVPSTSSAVSLTDLKDYLRITDNNDDKTLRIILAASTERLETYTQRSFQTATFKMTFDDFYSDVIYLTHPPVVSITSVVYYNESNVATTLSSTYYRVSTARDAVILNDGFTWPAVSRDHTGVEITYMAGYGTVQGSVPEAVKMALMVDCAGLYESRGSGCEIKPMVKDLLSPYRMVDRLSVMAGDNIRYGL